MAQNTGLRGGKSRPGGAKIFPGGQLPPYFLRLWKFHMLIKDMQYVIKSIIIYQPRFHIPFWLTHNYTCFCVTYVLAWAKTSHGRIFLQEHELVGMR